MGVTLYPKSWQGAPFYPETNAAILLLINASGRRYCLSTVDVDVQEMNSGQLLRFVGGIDSDPVHREAVDVKSRQSAPQSMRFNVMSEYFPLKDLRKAGIILQDIDVLVYWAVLGRDYSMPRARLLLEGKLQSPTFDETERTVSFLVQDNRLEGERMFPPIVASQDRIVNLAAEQSGKAYPIIIGTVKKAPVLDISGGAFDDFLVMHDPFSEFSGGGVVTAVYDGDATGPPTINAQGSATDLQGATYWQVDLVVGASGRDVTADVVGHSPSAPADVIQYLLNFFTNKSSVFSPGFLKEIILKLSAVEMAFIINSRPARGGAISFIRNRVLGQLPVALMPIADKYRFKVVDWQREPSKILSYQDGSLLDLTNGPYETKLSEVFNEFVFRYGRSGLRGGSTGVVVKNADNNRLCYLSQRRYGNRVMGDIDLGDIVNLDGANIIADWFVDTYSKMRVHCSYRCSLQVENLELLETMRVDDRYQQWNTKFLTTGVSRSTGKSQGVDLISTGDYYEVYRKEDSVTVYDNSRPNPAAPAKTIVAMLPLDLEAYYKLDSDALDSSPSGYDCTPTGINWGTPGKILTCAYYEDNADTIIADAWEGEGVLGDTPRTFSVWFRKNFFDLSADQIILYYGSSAGRHWEIQARRAAAAQPGCVGLRLGSTSFHWCDGLICDNTWKHFAITYSGVGTTAGIKFYVDGVEILNKFSSGTQSVLTGQLAKFSLGNRSGANSIKWGQIDEVGVWSRELSAQEIGWLWNNGNGLPYD